MSRGVSFRSGLFVLFFARCFLEASRCVDSANVPVSWGFNLNSATITANTGDTIVFTYSNLHDVRLVTSQTAWENCDFTGSTLVGSNSDSPASFTVNSLPAYFACDVPGHCPAGVKLAVNPAAANPPPATPPPATPPPPTTPPPTTAPPIVQPSSTPTTSPSSGGAPTAAAGAASIPPASPSTSQSGCPSISFNASVVPDSNLADGVTVTFTNTDSRKRLAWVDFHVSINVKLVAGAASVDAPEYNYRMQPSPSDSNSFTIHFPTGADDVDLSTTDYINYFFTYCSQDRTVANAALIDCNTGVFNYQPQPPSGGFVEGAPAACPAVEFNQSVTDANDAVTFTWFSTTPAVPISFVDIHITIVNSSTENGQFNYRMFSSPVTTSQASQFSGFVPTELFFYKAPGADGVSVPDDGHVTYFFTYCANHTDCNTDTFRLVETGAGYSSEENYGD